MNFVKLMVCVVMAWSAGAQASDDLNQQIERLAQLVNVGTNGGDASVYDYDVKTFSEQKRREERLAQLAQGKEEGNECSFVPLFERADVTSSVAFFDADEAEQLVNKLLKSGAIKAINGYDWDGEEGDSEYCSVGDLEIYFTNGKVLMISHNSTT